MWASPVAPHHSYSTAVPAPTTSVEEVLFSRKRASRGKNSTDDPSDESQRKTTDFVKDDARGGKDATAYDDPNIDPYAIQRRQLSVQSRRSGGAVRSGRADGSLRRE